VLSQLKLFQASQEDKILENLLALIGVKKKATEKTLGFFL